MLFNPKFSRNFLNVKALSLAFSLAAVVFSTDIFCQNDSIPGTGLVRIDVLNEETVNSDQLEFSPTFFEDGIVFSSTNPAGLKKENDLKLRRPATSILHSRRGADGKLSKPEPFAKELATRFNEGPVSFDRTAETIFFSRNILKKGQQKRDKKGINRMAIYTSKLEGAVWSKPEELPFNTDAQWDDVHPSLHIDGDKLYFASNRPGGFGGMDLYIAFKNASTGGWGEPINLGATINTLKNEVFPFIHADNTLYFASTGHDENQGGLDIYFVQPDENGWTKPVNLGQPFNTPGDDFGLIVDLDKINGYFSSNGVKGKGADEILSFQAENGNLDEYLLQNGRGSKKLLHVLVTVFESNGDPIEAADVKIVSLAGNNIIGKDSLGRTISVTSVNGRDVLKVGDEGQPPVLGTTDTGGRFETELVGGNYALIISKAGFQSKQLTRQVLEDNLELVVTLDKGDGRVHLLADLVNPTNGQPLAGATIIFRDRLTGETDTAYSDGQGKLDYSLRGGKNYDVTVFQGSREVGKTTVSTEKFQPGESGELALKLEISSTPFVAGNVIRLPNIYYNFNDASIRPDAQTDLDAVSAILQLFPKLVFELAAHTDSRGTTAYNDALSERRAKNAANYLLEKGTAKARLNPRGYGEREPVNRCEDGITCPENQHSLNRRTELRVIEGLQPGQIILTVVREVKAEKMVVIEQPAEPTTAPLAEKGVEKKPAKPSKPIAERTPAKPKINTPPTKIATGRATYFVVCGSFLMESRAKKRLGQVQKLGFNEAKFTTFADEKEFTCVTVLETNSFDEAQSYATELKAKHDIKTRVKTVSNQ